MHKTVRNTCAQYVRNLLVSRVRRGALSTGTHVNLGVGAYNLVVTPCSVNTFTSYLYPVPKGSVTSVISRFSPLSTPPITTTSSVNKELFIIEQGA